MFCLGRLSSQPICRLPPESKGSVRDATRHAFFTMYMADVWKLVWDPWRFEISEDVWCVVQWECESVRDEIKLFVMCNVWLCNAWSVRCDQWGVICVMCVLYVLCVTCDVWWVYDIINNDFTVPFCKRHPGSGRYVTRGGVELDDAGMQLWFELLFGSVGNNRMPLVFFHSHPLSYHSCKNCYKREVTWLER